MGGVLMLGVMVLISAFQSRILSEIEVDLIFETTA
jgi:hypothetical protein